VCRRVGAPKFGLVEMRRDKAPFGRLANPQEPVPRIENHTEQTDNAVGNIVSTL
jgi:hypothetical protein